MVSSPPAQSGRDSSKLSVTALYTSAAWSSAALPQADIFLTKRAKNVFAIVNGVLAIVRWFRRDIASLPCSLIFRHETIDRVVAQSGCKRIVELAAGLSARGLRMSDDPDILYTEVDLPHVIALKQDLINQAMLAKRCTIRPNLRFVVKDIINEDLTDLLDREDRTVALIAEGFLMYLTDEARLAFLLKCVKLLAFAPGSLLVFDFVPPAEKTRDGRSGALLERLMKIFTAGRGFEHITKTRDDIRNELLQAGFQRVEYIEPTATQKRQQKIEQLLFVARL